MNTHPENSRDPLKTYLLSGIEEKAPVDFTGKVMNLISLEPRPARPSVSGLKKNIIPLVSLGVAAILAGLVLIIPSSGYDVVLPGWMGVVNKLRPLQEISGIDPLREVNLPAYLPYLFLSILILTLIDRGLNTFFHRGK